MSRFFTGLIALIVTIAIVVVGGAFALKKMGFNLSETTSVTSDSRIVESIEMKQDIVLMHVNTHGLFDETLNNVKKLGITVPDSDRRLILSYRYTANLGIDGKDVDIKKTGEKSYTITIPPFKVLGTSDLKWEKEISLDGSLSFVNEEINRSKIQTCLLSDETLSRKHLPESDELMRDQAEAFYSTIVHGIDPEIELTFEFTEQPTPTLTPTAASTDSGSDESGCSSLSNESPSPSATATASSKKGN